MPKKLRAGSSEKINSEIVANIEEARVRIETALRLGNMALEASGVRELLAEKERIYLDMVSRGVWHEEIKRELGDLPRKKYKAVTATTLVKLGAKNKPHAVRRAIDTGIIRIEQDADMPGGAIPYRPELGTREIEVLASMSNGYSAQETADELGTSLSTVKNQRLNIISKLGAKSGAHAIRRAYETGIFEAPDGELARWVESLNFIQNAQDLLKPENDTGRRI